MAKGKRLDAKVMNEILNYDGNESTVAVCKRVGISPSSFYTWRSNQKKKKKKKKKTPKPTLTEFALPKVERNGFLFVGTPEFLAGVMSQLR